MLTRYWFRVDRGYGFGVTAESVADAELLLAFAGFVRGRDFEVVDIFENVDVRTLDQDHVVPNMGPPNIPGIWFPRLNL
jgi:hypothetical protein